MTDTDRIKHARLYLDKLANGISPLDDTPVPDGEIIHNVHVSRCFSYVAELLEKVTEKGAELSGKPKKRPFFITEEQCGNFAFSDTPITVSDIARRLNAAAEVTGGETRLRYSSITFWLIENGLLSIDKHSDGNETKKPTVEGERLGIAVEQRNGKSGKYSVVVYDKAAQHHIVDNINAIVAMEKQRFQMQEQPWRQEDDRIIEQRCKDGVPVYEISLELKRNVASVRCRCKKLGVTLPQQHNDNGTSELRKNRA